MLCLPPSPSLNPINPTRDRRTDARDSIQEKRKPDEGRRFLWDHKIYP